MLTLRTVSVHPTAVCLHPAGDDPRAPREILSWLRLIKPRLSAKYRLGIPVSKQIKILEKLLILTSGSHFNAVHLYFVALI